jgi:uncharacterized protein (DUF1810 family)
MTHRAALADFVAAQDRVWPAVEAELTAGRKASHWMWFVFPQIEGLGRSETARFFALADLAAAQGYLDHPVLGPRLRHAVGLILRHAGTPPQAILGGIDAAKYRSCLTLFAAAAPDETIFTESLEAFYESPCPRTGALLGS